jgi:hypothetical protein
MAQPAPPAQQQYTPAPAYAPLPQQQWAPPPARATRPRWVAGALWGAVAVSAVVAVAAIIAPFNTAMDDTTRWVWVAFGVLAAAATGVALASVLAIGFRIGAGARLGSAAGVGLVLLLALGGANAYGLGQKTSTVTGGAPSPSARPTACSIIKPNTAIAMSAIGTSCGFKPTATVTALDCTSVTALPGPLKAESFDATGKASQLGTFSIDNVGCHLMTPTYGVSSQLDSSAKVDRSNILMVVDFQEPQSDADVGLSYGCDDIGCITTDLFTVDSSVYIGEDANDKLVSQTVHPVLGVNRLVLVIQGYQVKSWFNGTLIATETASRQHDAGYYQLWVVNAQKSDPQPVELQVVRFGVFDLA